MRHTILIIIALIFTGETTLFSQTTPKMYSHKVKVDSAYQTQAYSYLRTTEKLKDRDSVLWLALPLIPVQGGETFYYENGMAMGQFTSKELKRTFNQILFLGGISTSPEVNEKTILPAPVIDTVPKNLPRPVMHNVLVKEVIQASSYTYLRVVEDKEEHWLAVVKIDAKPGQTYHYDDAVAMDDFYSKELKRTFKQILFLSKLTIGPGLEDRAATLKKEAGAESKKYAKAMSQPAKVVISIADLLENKKLYIGRKISVKGEVTKYSSNILEKNWVHITDGTSYIGKSDLVLTTDKPLKVGDKVTFEGILSENKDFGNGYFFELIVEDAKVKE